VLAGLEVAAALLAEEVAHERSLAVAFFTNEEGVRFAPDMMGSLVYAGGLPLTTALDCIGTDGARLGDELARIGYAGTAPLGIHRPCAFLELHIEQGPVLEAEGKTIGVVDSVQGISWTAYDIKGVSNHAGTTPMHLRRDAGYVAAELICFVRALARRCGGSQVSTVGRVVLEPNLVNVIARRAHLTVDLRNTEANVLRRAEKEVASFVIELAERERVDIASTPLVRLDPVCFDRDLVARVEATAGALGYSSRRMPSGAGHDAQMMARICPTAMIFVPSVAGISHNVREFSRPEHIEAGLQVLADLTLELLNK
jgi:N-carbamoyl-L-amino-acid hydrolase